MAWCKEKDKSDDVKPIEVPGPLFKFTSNGKDFAGVATFRNADTITVLPNNKLTEIFTYNADESEGLQFLIAARKVGSYAINDQNVTYTNLVFNYFNPKKTLEAVSGTGTITKYDLVNKKLSGTFSLNLGLSNFEPTITKVVTNGVFNDIKFTK